MDRPQWRFTANYRLHQRLQVGGVSIDEDKDRLEKIKKMVDKLDISYPIFVDAKQTPAWYQFKVKAIPAMYLLDEESQIVAQWEGSIATVGKKAPS